MARNGFDALADLCFWGAIDAWARGFPIAREYGIDYARTIALGRLARDGWWPRYVGVGDGPIYKLWREWDWHHFAR